MSVDLSLAKMSVADKLQAMDLLWADLSKDAAQVVSPPWHGDVLRSRESAMGELRAELRGHQAP